MASPRIIAANEPLGLVPSDEENVLAQKERKKSSGVFCGNLLLNKNSSVVVNAIVGPVTEVVVETGQNLGFDHHLCR